jgi:hypothetical protein
VQHALRVQLHTVEVDCTIRSVHMLHVLSIGMVVVAAAAVAAPDRRKTGHEVVEAVSSGFAFTRMHILQGKY